MSVSFLYQNCQIKKNTDHKFREKIFVISKNTKQKDTSKNGTEVNPLSANPIKWPNTLKQFVGKLPTNCLSVFDHFVKFALKGFK